jgi:2-dehydro-3-deoxyphosphogluconate aldolase / (4S)-4-hydroxy-2-oxoglutarate aldolase
MVEKRKVRELITGQGILPLYFHPDPDVSKEVLRAVYRSGIRTIEYTNRGESALANFQLLVACRNQELEGMVLGAGTIKTQDEANRYMDAGADFLVSPGLNTEICRFALDNGFFYAPGCMTPSEIVAAENMGLDFIKLFPGNLLGPAFVSSIKDIFPKLSFMPTGGVDTSAENLREWFSAGVAAVGMGSKLISKKLMEDHDYGTIAESASKVLGLIAGIKR